VRPLAAYEDGRGGYRVEAVSTAPGQRSRRLRLRARGIVFAASSLGTQDLLFRLRTSGSLPRISAALGCGVRTNAESLIGVRFPGSPVDLSQGIAIGSGVYIDQHTHIEATRYPRGSDAMALLSTVLTRGRPGVARWFAWLLALARMAVRRPWTTLRTLQPFGWAREVIIFLCMQTVDGQLTMKLRRPWYWPFAQRLSTSGPRIPTFIPAANDFAAKAAQAAGGVAMTSLSEILFNIPMTAHCIGGAAIGASPATGVCDARQRVFGYRNMYICDGSVLAANLGVNPSLTITALAEHAMSHVPSAACQQWDAIGEEAPHA
jgi:cholesterol oxidase